MQLYQVVEGGYGRPYMVLVNNSNNIWYVLNTTTINKFGPGDPDAPNCWNL